MVEVLFCDLWSTKQARIIRYWFVTPLGPLLFDGLPVWQVISRNTQITWNWELVSVDLGGGSGGIDYPSGLNNLGLFLFHLNMEFFGGRRIKLARAPAHPPLFPWTAWSTCPRGRTCWHQPWHNGEKSILHTGTNSPPPAAWCQYRSAWFPAKEKKILKALSDVNF